MTKLRLDYYDAKRARLPQALMKRIKLRRLGRTSGYTVWAVDGSVVRSEVDIDFALGGNLARYSYVPENEVWLEATGDDADMKATFMHEIMEADAMRRGYSYDDAHEMASHGEAKIRSLGSAALPVFRPNPAFAPVRVFHGTSSDALPAIRAEGLTSAMGYHAPGWYMVAEDFVSAAFHAQHAAGAYGVVVELLVPAGGELRDGRRRWAGFPYLWKPVLLSWHGVTTRWWALRSPLPPEFVVAVHPADAEPRSNPEQEVFHLLGFDHNGKQVAHDMQASRDAAAYRARRLLADDPATVRVAVHRGTLLEHEPGAVEEFVAPRPTPMDARSASEAYYNFWISPHGEIYPVEAYGHATNEWLMIKYGIVPFIEETMASGSPAIAAGWLQVSATDTDVPMFDYTRTPAQRQLDAVFDLAQAHKERTKAYGSHRRELFWQEALRWLAAPSRTRCNPSAPERIRTVCADCGAVIFDVPLGPGGELSHGICPACYVVFGQSMGMTEEEIAADLAELAAKLRK